jgi:phage major head subunit gpT-like protein
MATAYKAATTTYEAWTSRGSNPDFKAATVYQISEAGELLPMTQSGEFKFDEMTDQGVTKAVATFGRSFGMTRQALINDDIGILTRVPEAYVRAARRGINKLVYKMLGSNPTIYDGKTLFHAQHNNLASTAGAIGTDTIGEGRKAMRKQKNLRGKETLNISPAFLIVPAALETVAQKFLMSTADPNQTNPGVVNIFRNSLNLVVDAELDDYSETAWYLAASPSDIDTIEITYLNGNDMPILESQVGFDFLGIKWRIYIDYGVTVLDYRGLYKNSGA